MIITLKGADFSGAGNNIGNLSQIGGTFTFTINPTPSDATVKINGTTRKSITGTYGTAISWEVSKDGYNTRTGSLTMPLGGKTMSVSLTAVGSTTPPVTPEEPGTGGGSGETPSNLLSLGTLKEKTVTTSTTDTTLKSDVNYFTYVDVPVSPNTKYISVGARRVFFLNSSKTALSASVNANNNTPQGTFTTPNNCVYVTISYKYDDLQPSDAVMTLN